VHLPPCRDAPATLLDFLVDRFPRIGREVWLERFRRGLVTDEGGLQLDSGLPYRAHLKVFYYREWAEDAAHFGAPQIVFGDENLVVVDKPPFQPVVPSGPWVRSSLLYQVMAHLEEAGEPSPELSPVHRLDRATSGLVVFARHAAVRGLYGKLFAERQVEKVYSALAELCALPARRSFHLESRLVVGEPFFRMCEEPGSVNAETEVQLVDTVEASGRLFGHFELRPLTGKKHQLRVHMASLGFPILGDRYYPELLPELPDEKVAPLGLLARRLVFRDPHSGSSLVFTSRREVESLLPKAVTFSARGSK